MITAGQMRAARALLQIDQRQLAEISGLSLPTIQRMEASDGFIRGNIESLSKLVAALNAAGIELIAEGAASQDGGRGVRLRSTARMTPSCSAFLGCSRPGPPARSTPVRRADRIVRLRRQPGAQRHHRPGRRCRARRVPPPRSSCRLGCRGSARISGSTRWPPSSCWWSISAAPRRASTRSAMAGTKPCRSGCCRSIRSFSPA